MRVLMILKFTRRDNSQSNRMADQFGTAKRMTRLGDVVIAGILLAITLPLMLIVALAIKGESSGPAFERRERIDPNGRRFQTLSFRTTAQRPGPIRPIWQPTPVGHFLRSTRIEALPQLFNVLRGERSLFETSLFD